MSVFSKNFRVNIYLYLNSAFCHPIEETAITDMSVANIFLDIFLIPRRYQDHPVNQFLKNTLKLIHYYLVLEIEIPFSTIMCY